MGLNERRAVEEFKTNHFPAFKKQVDQAAGFEVPMTVEWTTLAADGYSHLYNETYPKIFFEPLIAALKAVCSDQMGKDAVKGGLKKIVIHNSGGNSGPTGFSFESGTLTLDHLPCTNVDDVSARTDGIKTLLENGL
jgi:hypothetical protein